MASGLMTDGEQRGDMCVGTFRWKSSHKLPELPALAEGSSPSPAEAVGWSRWLQARYSLRSAAEAGELARADPSLLDGMSYPLTLALVLHMIGLERRVLCGGRVGHLDIVVAGASSKAEERLLRDSNYWAEVANIYPGLAMHLWMVGPEIESSGPGRLARGGGVDPKKVMKKKGGGGKKKKKKNKGADGGSCPPAEDGEPAAAASGYRLGALTTASAFRGTLKGFFAEHPDLATTSRQLHRRQQGRPDSLALTVVVGFNPGFGSGNPDMLTSWLGDLVFVARRGLPLIFTQANDYSDLRGELAVLQRAVGAKWVLAPSRNPFHAATCAQDPGRPASWACANSYFYVVQGFSDPGRGPIVDVASPTMDGKRAAAKTLASLARALQLADHMGGVKHPGGCDGEDLERLAGLRPEIDLGEVDLGLLRGEGRDDGDDAAGGRNSADTRDGAVADTRSPKFPVPSPAAAAVATTAAAATTTAAAAAAAAAAAEKSVAPRVATTPGTVAATTSAKATLETGETIAGVGGRAGEKEGGSRGEAVEAVTEALRGDRGHRKAGLVPRLPTSGAAALSSILSEAVVAASAPKEGTTTATAAQQAQHYDLYRSSTTMYDLED